MSNDKVTATFHGADPAQARLDDLALDRPTFDQAALDREMGESMADPEITPEQDLRAHVAERIADAIHFNGCVAQRPGDRNCTCLVGRLHWAINAEQVTTPADTDAIELAAREVTDRIISDAVIGDQWENYPEIGAYDWERIAERVQERSSAQKPGDVAWFAAYAELKRRAEAWAAENDGGAA